MTAANQQNNNNPNNQQQLMMKSISSNSGDLDSSLSQSNVLPLATLQLKRTYCYAIVHAKTKQITFYCFTTEVSNYDSIKQLLEQAAETISQRHMLVNNIVLYKFGGLIGDNLMYDIKKVKQLTVSPSGGSDLVGGMESPNSDLKFIKSGLQSLGQPHQQQAVSNNHALKMSKSPTMLRQLSLGKGLVNSVINPSLITSLQFSPNTSSQTTGFSSKNFIHMI